jgi:hemoglobin-like flavoprotein
MSTPTPSNSTPPSTANSQIIRDSFALLAPHAGKLMDRFYERLFARAPQVRSMFPADMTKQKAHLAAAVGLVVKHADNLAALEKPLLDMGARHVNYGAKAEHYPIVRDEMLGAIKDVAGPVWTPAIHAAWSEALNAVAAVMIRGAEQAERKAA